MLASASCTTPNSTPLARRVSSVCATQASASPLRSARAMMVAQGGDQQPKPHAGSNQTIGVASPPLAGEPAASAGTSLRPGRVRV